MLLRCQQTTEQPWIHSVIKKNNFSLAMKLFWTQLSACMTSVHSICLCWVQSIFVAHFVSFKSAKFECNIYGANWNCVFQLLAFMLLQYDWWDREQTQICMVYNRDLIVWKLLGGPWWICCTRLKESRKLKWDKNRR